MSAESDRDLVVTGWQQVTASQTIGAEIAQLDLVFGVPASVVADDGDKRKLIADSGIDLRSVEAEGAIAEHRDHRRVRFGESGGKCERQCRADGAGNAIDDAIRCLQAGLCPLAEFATIADEDRIGVGIQHGLQRKQGLRRMQAARLRRCRGRPGCGSTTDCIVHLRLPLSGHALATSSNNQRIDCRSDVCLFGAEQAGAHGATGSIEFFGFGIDLREAAVPAQRWHLAELQGEIKTFPEQKQAIALCKHASELAQRWILDTTWAFHADHRHPRRIFKCRQTSAATLVHE